MRIIIGILVFVVWSSASTYWYVCKIKEICNNDKVTTVEPVKQEIVEKIKPEKDEVHFDFTTLTVYFPFAQAKADLSSELADSIKIFSEKLILAKKVTLIIGNTDNIGSASFNMKLGLDRAEWVKSLFISYGVEQNKIEIKSLGEDKPVENNNMESGRSKNRRVEIGIL